MRKLVFILLVSSLILSLGLMRGGSILSVKASPSIFQGNLIISGNNVTTIQGRFDINGSIIVTGNATLVLKNAVVNLTQTSDRQFNITFRTPVNGHPKLLASNSTITSKLESVVYLEDNSTAILNHSTVSWNLDAVGHSTLTVLNSSYVLWAWWYSSSNITVYNSTMYEWMTYDSAQVKAYYSKIGDLLIGPRSVNCTISSLKPGNFSSWNSLVNCNVTILPGGSCPNVTLTNSEVDSWRFGFYGSSNAKVTRSAISETSGLDSSVAHISWCNISSVNSYYSAKTLAYNSSINLLTGVSSSQTWLVNSTYHAFTVQNTAKVYVDWYLSAHVVDSLNQSVPSANVTVTYSNMTVAGSKLTDNHGWVQFPMMAKMINATGDYPIGNYTVEASYLTHSNSTTVNMTSNKQIELTLGLVIPEFAHFLVLPLFMIVTLLAVVIYINKKETPCKHPEKKSKAGECFPQQVAECHPKSSTAYPYHMPTLLIIPSDYPCDYHMDVSYPNLPTEQNPHPKDLNYGHIGIKRPKVV